MEVKFKLLGEADVQQQLRILLNTQMGSVPFRENLGLDAPELLDSATELDIKTAIADQVTTYIKEITLKKIEIVTIDKGVKNVVIIYTYNNQLQRTELTLNN